MALLERAEISIPLQLNWVLNTSFKPEDIIFGKPTPATPSSPSLGYNTMVRVTCGQGAPMRGSTYINYHRVVLSESFTSVDDYYPMTITVSGSELTLHDCLPAIRQFLGIEMYERDVENTELNWGDMEVRVAALPDSLTFLGEIQAKLKIGDAVFSDVFSNTDLTPLFAYPHENTLMGPAQIYSYRYDFSADGEILKAITEQTLDLNALGLILTRTTNHRWVVARNPGAYNLKEAAFVYNGLNDANTFNSNANYSRLLILELSLNCTNLGGKLYLHYNA